MAKNHGSNGRAMQNHCGVNRMQLHVVLMLGQPNATRPSWPNVIQRSRSEQDHPEYDLLLPNKVGKFALSTNPLSKLQLTSVL
eukprot:2406767-Amphidinium_carterae.1